MKVRIKYSLIPEVIDFFFGLSLKGKQSRHRSRFIRLLQEKWKQISDEEMLLLKEYAECESGVIKRKENGEFDVKDIVGFNNQQLILFNEEYIISGEEYQYMLKTVKEIILEFDDQISGEVAMVYDYLCDAFEVEEDQ